MRLQFHAGPMSTAAALAVPLIAVAAVWSVDPAEPRAPGAIPQSREVLVARVDDRAITPVTADYLVHAIEEASSSGAACLVIELDTPGGLMESTGDIVRAILGSRVPVVVYVAPSGARAASAGVFITLSAHIAAMTPGTHIGAAHPVQIGGSPMPGSAPDSGEKQSDSGQNPMNEKILNDAVAWIRSLAELRGRNAEWAESAVTESSSISSSEAVKLNVVDLLAGDVHDLLSKIDGRVVSVGADSVALDTGGAEVREFEMWWGQRILSVLSDPNIAFILLMLGFYGIFFELYTPGWGVAGTVGAICLILAFFGLAVLPVNYAGLLLIFLAIGLFVAEAFISSFGLLTLGGTVCLVLGGIMLINSPFPLMRISLAVLIPVAIGTALIAFFLAGKAFSSFRLRIQTGTESMVGATAIASEDFSEAHERFAGMVQVHGELWRAVSKRPVARGARLVIDGNEGLTLFVSETSPSTKGGSS